MFLNHIHTQQPRSLRMTPALPSYNPSVHCGTSQNVSKKLILLSGTGQRRGGPVLAGNKTGLVTVICGPLRDAARPARPQYTVKMIIPFRRSSVSNVIIKHKCGDLVIIKISYFFFFVFIFFSGARKWERESVKKKAPLLFINMYLLAKTQGL